MLRSSPAWWLIGYLSYPAYVGLFLLNAMLCSLIVSVFLILVVDARV